MVALSATDDLVMGNQTQVLLAVEADREQPHPEVIVTINDARSPPQP